METGKWDEIRGKLDFARAGKPLLIGMAAILVLVAVASGRVLSGAATASDFVVSSSSQEQSRESSEPPATSTLFVHVSGSVRNPGLYEVEEGSRVADVVQAAGGFTDDASEDSINLARVLEDGEHVVVLSSEQASAPVETAGQGQQAGSAPVNINTASADQLESLPGIGGVTAKKIVDDRTANGPFKSVNDLTRVSGIGEKKIAALEGLICV